MEEHCARAEHFRDQALRLRRSADDYAGETEIRALMLMIADQYDELAAVHLRLLNAKRTGSER